MVALRPRKRMVSRPNFGGQIRGANKTLQIKRKALHSEGVPEE